MTKHSPDTPNKHTEDDEIIFAQAMDDVTPLRFRTCRMPLNRQHNIDTDSLRRRRLAAAKTSNQQDTNYLSLDFIPKLNPLDHLAYRKAGIQEGVYRKLRLGQYTIEAGLDLHRHTVAQAREQVLSFIKDAHKHHLRTLIILHGKGERSTEKAVIKSHVTFWLTQIPEVIAYHSAQPKHGGLGAVYVLLQKNVLKKQENRERARNKKF